MTTPNETNPTTETLDIWALVELMGHQKIAGRVTEKTLAGAPFLQVDVPDGEGKPAYTRLYAPGAIYCINPIAQQIAIGWAKAHKPAPVQIYDLRQLAADKPIDSTDSDPEVDGRYS